MFNQYFKIFFILTCFFINPLYAKNTDSNDFNLKSLSNYFSAIISYDNNQNTDALRFFNSSKSLIKTHDPYLKKYIFSLIMEGKIDRAINELKYKLNNKNVDFLEGYLLLTLDSIKRKDYKKSKKYLKKITRFKKNGSIELIIHESLRDYIYLFENKKILLNKNNFGNLSLINKVFQNCYLDKQDTKNYFENLINNYDANYSRYVYFYISYLIQENQINEAKILSNQINNLNSSLLASQAKEWIDQKKFSKFGKFFSCNSEADILSEFFFLLANLYSNENILEKSNLFLNMSYYLNPKFIFNLSLLSDNHYNNNNFKISKKLLKVFDSNNNVYYWHKIKVESKIILKEQGQEESFNFINSKFKKINNPSNKILFDMANLSKSFKKYDLAIKYYDQVISVTDKKSDLYADLLYRRGGSYERLGKFNKSDEDLLESLEINPDDAYVLNYLAYSWLERGFKIQSAIKMLEKAHQKRKNDPYILDSVGWAYYLINDYKKAKYFIQKAIILMPDDPVVNDHYGDILWKLDNKIQASYYWRAALTFIDTNKIMKENIKIKLLRGPNKI